MTDPSGIVGSSRAAIGRYFSVVSALPSLFLVVWHVMLVSSGAWTGTPNAATAIRALTDPDLGRTAALLLASIVVGVVLHPLQFAFVQLLEGYWGTGTLAQQARQFRIWHYYRRWRKLRIEAFATAAELEQMDKLVESGHFENATEQQNRLVRTSLRDEVDRTTADLPSKVAQTMPTRLGNVLRYYERSAGAPYGLDTVRVLPFLSRVAPAGDMEYVNDQRSQLDLAVRVTIVSLLCCASSVVFLARHGLWLLVALVPYLAAYLAYRGAVVAAGEYGRSLAVVIAVNRFALYDRLRVEPPVNTVDERARNTTLSDLLAYASNENTSVEYVGSSPPVSVPASSSSPVRTPGGVAPPRRGRRRR